MNVFKRFLTKTNNEKNKNLPYHKISRTVRNSLWIIKGGQYWRDYILLNKLSYNLLFLTLWLKWVSFKMVCKKSIYNYQSLSLSVLGL